MKPRNDSLKVTKFLTNMGLGGTEKQVAHLLRALEENVEVDVACFHQIGELVDEFCELGIPITEYRLRGLARASTLRQQYRFAMALRRRRIQVMHSYNFYANVFAVPAARLAGVPCVIASIQDTGAYLDARKARLQKLACRFAHRVVGNADAVRDWLVAQGYDPAKVEVIHNGLDVTPFMRPRGGHTLRDELGIPHSAPLIMMLSRVDPGKGIDYLVDATVKIARTIPQVHVVIVGGNFNGPYIDGSPCPEVAYRQEIEARAERLGIGARLHFTGFRKDVPQLLAEADVSVLPSLSEGLSNTLLESMAAGTPVVATRVGGTPEAIQHGVHGLLVEPRDADGLADALIRVLTDPEFGRLLGKRARQRVTERYSFERMARNTEALYEQVLGPQYMSVTRSQ